MDKTDIVGWQCRIPTSHQRLVEYLELPVALPVE